MHTGALSQAGSIGLSLAPDLAARLKSIEFFLNLVELKWIKYDDRTYPFELAPSDDIDELRSYREHLRVLDELFRILHVDTSLVLLSEMDDVQHKRLRLMHAAFMHGRQLRAEDGQVGRTDQAVGASRLMLLVTPGSEPDLWNVLDPFDPANRDKFRIYRKASDGIEEWQATVYDGVQTSDLPAILNLR